MYLLDTNAISALRKIGTPKGEVHVERWFASVDFDNLYLATISLLELESGIVRLERRDLRQATDLRQWYEGAVLTRFANHIFDFDTAAARATATLHTGPTPPFFDGMIAGIALSRDLTVATRNVVDFERMGVRVVNPWTYVGE